MKFKKLLSLLLTASMTVAMLAGCGGNAAQTTQEGAAATDTAATDTAQAGDSKEPVTLKTVSMFGGTDPMAPTYQEITEQFRTEFDYITVEDDSQKSDEPWKAKVAADFAVGNEPDVLQFFTDASANAIIATGKLATVEEIKAVYPEYAQDTLEASLNAVTNSDGVSRAIPTTGYWEGLFCNKDLFDKYNLALPTDWESFKKAVETFKANDIIPIACSLNQVPHYWIEFLMLYTAGEEGYKQIPETAPADWVKGLEGLKTLRDMGAFPEDTDTVDDAYVCQLFDDKKAAMQLDGSWRANGENIDQENTVVIPFPGLEGQKADAGAMVGGMSSGFYITKKAWDDPAKRDAAVKFVMYHTNKDAVAKYWGGNGSAATLVDPVDGMTPLGKSGLEYSQKATSISGPTDSRIDPEAYKVLIAGMAAVSTGDASAEELLNEVLAMSAERKLTTAE